MKWEKPEDDGGVPIKEYEIEKMDTKTGKWVRVGKIPGNSPNTEFEVTGLNPGSEYKFRVTAVNDEGDSEPLESERGVIAKNPYGISIFFIETYITTLIYQNKTEEISGKSHCLLFINKFLN